MGRSRRCLSSWSRRTHRHHTETGRWRMMVLGSVRGRRRQRGCGGGLGRARSVKIVFEMAARCWSSRGVVLSLGFFRRSVSTCPWLPARLRFILCIMKKLRQ